jgi:hypothetical protein
MPLARRRPGKDRVYYLEDVELTARRARTHIGIIQDPGHAEPWIIAMSEKPGYLRTLEYSARWGIEPMVSDFKSRGFGIEDTQLRYADRLDRLILVMSLALYVAVSTGQWDAVHHPTPSEKKSRRSAQESRPKQNLLVHPRASPHRQVDAILPAAAATLGRASELIDDKALYVLTILLAKSSADIRKRLKPSFELRWRWNNLPDDPEYTTVPEFANSIFDIMLGLFWTRRESWRVLHKHSPGQLPSGIRFDHSTVTDLARLRGRSTSVPRAKAM